MRCNEIVIYPVREMRGNVAVVVGLGVDFFRGEKKHKSPLLATHAEMLEYLRALLTTADMRPDWFGETVVEAAVREEHERHVAAMKQKGG